MENEIREKINELYGDKLIIENITESGKSRGEPKTNYTISIVVQGQSLVTIVSSADQTKTNVDRALHEAGITL